HAGLLLHRARYAVRREDHRGALGDLEELLHEHRSERAQPLHHVAVVHHLVAHVDRGAEELGRALDDVDRAVHAGAKAPRVGEQHLYHASTLRTERLSRHASISSASAPTVMAESATLNAGKYACPQCTWMKSTTLPDASRSIMLPSAPPMMSASPQASRPCAAARSRRGGACAAPAGIGVAAALPPPVSLTRISSARRGPRRWTRTGRTVAGGARPSPHPAAGASSARTSDRSSAAR